MAADLGTLPPPGDTHSIGLRTVAGCQGNLALVQGPPDNRRLVLGPPAVETVDWSGGRWEGVADLGFPHPGKTPLKSVPSLVLAILSDLTNGGLLAGSEADRGDSSHGGYCFERRGGAGTWKTVKTVAGSGCYPVERCGATRWCACSKSATGLAMTVETVNRPSFVSHVSYKDENHCDTSVSAKSYKTMHVYDATRMNSPQQGLQSRMCLYKASQTQKTVDLREFNSRQHGTACTYQCTWFRAAMSTKHPTFTSKYDATRMNSPQQGLQSRSRMCPYKASQTQKTVDLREFNSRQHGTACTYQCTWFRAAMSTKHPTFTSNYLNHVLCVLGGVIAGPASTLMPVRRWHPPPSAVCRDRLISCGQPR